MAGCVECEAAGSIASGWPHMTDEQHEAVAEAAATVHEPPAVLWLLDAWLDNLTRTLHDRCKSGRRCWCQHDRPWEQDDRPGVPAYVDALPAQDPRRVEYEATVGRKITR